MFCNIERFYASLFLISSRVFSYPSLSPTSRKYDLIPIILPFFAHSPFNQRSFNVNHQWSRLTPRSWIRERRERETAPELSAHLSRKWAQDL